MLEILKINSRIIEKSHGWAISGKFVHTDREHWNIGIILQKDTNSTFKKSVLRKTRILDLSVIYSF